MTRPDARPTTVHRAFDGELGYYSHHSEACNTTLRFALYRPPDVRSGSVPCVFYLAGLECTEQTFVTKACALATCAELGLMVVAPDTSPRGLGLQGEDDSWDLGSGAGFWLDATEEPWAGHYQMFSYVTDELPGLLQRQFGVDLGRLAIMGHSMGGHGALICALKRPDLFRSVSALAPICAPSQCPWGEKAFSAYLGPHPERWASYDTTELVRRRRIGCELLVDQGTEDRFLSQQLKPDLLSQACSEAGQALTLRMQPGYDHGYFFVQTFIGDHLKHHADALTG